MQPFTNETIGVEVQIDEDENPDEAFKMAKNLVNGWNMTSQASIKNGTPIEVPEEIYTSMGNEIAQKIINIQDEKIEIAIENAKTPADLGKLKPRISVNHTALYMKKLTELTSKIK